MESKFIQSKKGNIIAWDNLHWNDKMIEELSSQIIVMGGFGSCFADIQKKLNAKSNQVNEIEFNGSECVVGVERLTSDLLANNYSRLYFDVDCHSCDYSIIDIHKTIKNYIHTYCECDELFEPLICIAGYINGDENYKKLMKDKDSFKFPYCIWKRNAEINDKAFSFHIIVVNMLFSFSDLVEIIKPLRNNNTNIGKNGYCRFKFGDGNAVDLDPKPYNQYQNGDNKIQLLRFVFCDKQAGFQDKRFNTGIPNIHKKFEMNNWDKIFSFFVAGIFNKFESLQKYVYTAKENPNTNNVYVEINNPDKHIKETIKINPIEKETIKHENYQKLESSSDEDFSDDLSDNEYESDSDFQPATYKINNKLVECSQEEFNDKTSIYELAGCDPYNNKFEGIECFRYTFHDGDWCIIADEDRVEVKKFYDIREHNENFDKFFNRITKRIKINFYSNNVDKFRCIFQHNIKNAIYGSDINMCNIYDHLKRLSTAYQKHKHLTKNELKNLRTIQDTLKVEYDTEEELPNYNQEIKKCYTKLSEVNCKNNIDVKNIIYQKACNKLDGIIHRYLQIKYYETCNTTGFDNVCYFKDIEAYWYKNTVRTRTYIEHEFGDVFKKNIPEFDNQETMTKEKLVYNCVKTLKNHPDKVLDVPAWLKKFRNTFEDDYTYQVYLSWWHYKLNGKRLQFNLINCGDKNCLKSVFVKNLQHFYDMSGDISFAQLIDKYNGDILSKPIICLDEIDGIPKCDIGVLRETIKRWSTSNEIVIQNKNVKMYKTEIKFDIIINTNSENVILALLGNEQDVMLKRCRIIKRVQLTEKQINDPKFIHIEDDVVFQYQLYQYLKNKYEPLPMNKISNIHGENTTEYENELININHGNASLNGIDGLIADRIYDIFKPIKNKNLYKLNVSYFRDEFCKKHWIDVYTPIQHLKANAVIVYLKNETKMHLNTQGMCNKENLDKFVAYYTKCSTIEELIESFKNSDEDEQED